MLNRRQLRVKVLQVLYSFNQGNNRDLPGANRQLEASFDNFQQLYYALLGMLLAIQEFGEQKVEEAKKKRMATSADLNPNLKFLENQCFKILRDDAELMKQLEAPTIIWSEYRPFIRGLYYEMTNSDFYNQYISKEGGSLVEDADFMEQLYIKIIAPNEDFHEILEEHSVFFVDDMALGNSMVLKTISFMKKYEGKKPASLPLFKEEQDQKFTKKLLETCLLKNEELEEMVVEKAENWEKERIAVLDILMMKMALCEILYFPTVPVKVSINEYIELSKDYSTPKSKIFLNGVLDKLHKDLKSKNKIVKSGRGLIE